MMLVRFALYLTLGYLIHSLGYAWDTAEFWCFLGLFWGAETISRHEGEQQGVAKVLSMPLAKIANIQRMVRAIDAGADVSEQELINELRKEDKDYEDKP